MTAGHVVLACVSGKHADVWPGATGTLRLRCRGNRCRIDRDLAVYHTFDLATGRLVETRYYRKGEAPTSERAPVALPA